MRVLGIIPARAGSKRLPGKNVKPLGGKELIAWAIEAAQRARSIDRLVVSSDDPGVLGIAVRYDAELPLARPPELSGDVSPAIDYVRHAVAHFAARGETFDAVVIVQATSPFTTAADIDATLAVLEATGAETAVSVMRAAHAAHPVKFKRLVGDRLLPYFEDEAGRMAAHELGEVYVRNCAVYAARMDVVSGGRIIGDDCRGYVMPRSRSIDINDADDFDYAEFLLSRLRPPVPPELPEQ